MPSGFKSAPEKKPTPTFPFGVPDGSPETNPKKGTLKGGISLRVDSTFPHPILLNKEATPFPIVPSFEERAPQMNGEGTAR